MHRWSTLSAAGLLLAVMAAVPSSSSPRPMDYVLQDEGRSEAIYPELVTDGVHLAAPSGAEIYVEVTRPDPDVYPGLRVPVIMQVSPYNNWFMADRAGISLIQEAVDEDGNQIGMRGWFAPRGYAWMSVDLPGSGHSSGCFDHLGPADQEDLAEVVEWAATQDWSTGRIGTIGHSYIGFAALTTAAVGGPAVVTAVSSAGGASLYDHQFQKGVPYALQWAGTSLYPGLAAIRYLGESNYGRELPGAACGFASASATDGASQVTGQFGPWHAARDQRSTLVDRADLDLFIVQGIDDVQIRPTAMEWFLTDRAPRTTDKLWLGPWTHHEEGHLNGRTGQWLEALHAWFDRTLQQRDVSTGPAIEAFFDDDEAVALGQWEPARNALTLYPDAGDLSLRLAPPTAPAAAAFTAHGNYEGVDRTQNTSIHPAIGDRGVDFVSEPLQSDIVLVGLPQLDLHASVTGEIVHLVTKLYRIDEDGDERLLNVCAIQPQLRNGVETIEPVVPGEVMNLPLQCFATTHHLNAGDRLRLHVGTGSTHHVGTFSADARIEVVTGPDATAYRLPSRPDLTVYEAPTTAAS